MARKVFFSFHFDNDFWRTQQVRNMNVLEGNRVVTPNKWEEVKEKGSAAIESWIDDEMFGKSCIVVLVGAETSERKWVKREIAKGWQKNKGVLGIRINKLLDNAGKSSTSGYNPFSTFKIGNKEMDAVVPLKNPAGSTSKEVYASISDNIEDWIEEAIEIRGAN